MTARQLPALLAATLAIWLATVVLATAAEQPASVARFIELLSDPDVRAFLDGAAKATPAVTMPEVLGAIDEPPLVAHNPVDALAARFEQWKVGVRTLPDEFLSTRARIRQEAVNTGSGQLFGFAVLCLLVGLVLERLFWRASRPLRLRIVKAPRVSAGDRSVLFIARVTIMLISVGMVAIGFIGGFFAIGWPKVVHPILLNLFWVILTGTFTAMLARLLVAPWYPRLRMIPMGTRSAFVVFRWAVGVASAGAFGFFAAAMFEQMGASPASSGLIFDGAAALVALLFIAFVWRWRAVSASDPDTVARRSIGSELERWFWTIAAIAVVAALFAGLRGIGVTVASVALVPTIVSILRQITRAIVDGRTGTAPEVEQSAASDLSVLAERIVRALVIFGALVLNVDAWGLSLGSIAAQDTPASRAMSAAIQVLVTLLIADFVWHLARRWIDRRISAGVRGPDEHTRLNRIEMLLPLFRKTLAVMLIIMVGLIVLSAVGVEIGPLLGAAGIFGIAIGFGAQTLVKDIITGVFFLLEDAFRVGEYVEIGSTRGTVEAISLRSLRLRHHRGALHTLPFGEINSLTNHSRDWVIVKIEFPFALNVDTAKVKKVVKAVSAEITADPELSKNLLEPPKSQGIRRLENYSAVIGVKFMSRPGNEQFAVRREIYQRLLKAFEAAGLRLSSRDVVVVGSPDGGPPPPAELAAAVVATETKTTSGSAG